MHTFCPTCGAPRDQEDLIQVRKGTSITEVQVGMRRIDLPQPVTFAVGEMVSFEEIMRRGGMSDDEIAAFMAT